MSETFGNAEKRYIDGEDIAHRLGLSFFGNEYVASEEYEDDWVRLLDATDIIIQLEADNEALKLSNGRLKSSERQNERMRSWFKKRTGLDDILLNTHMEAIDIMLEASK